MDSVVICSLSAEDVNHCPLPLHGADLAGQGRGELNVEGQEAQYPIWCQLSTYRECGQGPAPSGRGLSPSPAQHQSAIFTKASKTLKGIR